MKKLTFTSPLEINTFLLSLNVGSVFKWRKVEYVVLGSSFNQKTFEPLNKNHRSGSSNYLFNLDEQLREISGSVGSYLYSDLSIGIIFER